VLASLACRPPARAAKDRTNGGRRAKPDPNQVLPYDETAERSYAAICESRGAALATRNLKDFRDTGIDLIDPWAHTPAE